MQKIAFITGITGQDGSYLAHLLLSKGYRVHGLVRRSSGGNTHRLEEVCQPLGREARERLVFHYGDMTDSLNINRLVESIRPDEIYNLAAQSHVHVSFETPIFTSDVNALGALRILEAVRCADLSGKTRIYQASTSELFGKVAQSPQTEQTPFHPRSPYGVAKLYAYWITRNYRESYDIFASNGILFNHESPYRVENFVTKKISLAVARIACGRQDVLRLGNLDAKRDWGHARDYVDAMWRILQHGEPDDFVIATGRQHSVREFVEQSFACLGYAIRWEGAGVNEVGIARVPVLCTEESGMSGQLEERVVVAVAPEFFRPAEVDTLLGDYTKAKTVLGWAPATSFAQLVAEMVDYDYRAVMKNCESGRI